MDKTTAIFVFFVQLPNLVEKKLDFGSADIYSLI